jgi:hypothetical protein
MTQAMNLRQRIAIALLVILGMLALMFATAAPTYSAGGTPTPAPRPTDVQDARWGS